MGLKGDSFKLDMLSENFSFYCIMNSDDSLEIEA